MSTLVRLLGIAVLLFGLGLAGASLLAGSGELQVLFGVFALSGLLIGLGGGVLWLIGALLGRGKAKPTGPHLSPEQQQRLDSQEFLATQHDE